MHLLLVHLPLDHHHRLLDRCLRLLVHRLLLLLHRLLVHRLLLLVHCLLVHRLLLGQVLSVWLIRLPITTPDHAI